MDHRATALALALAATPMGAQASPAFDAFKRLCIDTDAAPQVVLMTAASDGWVAVPFDRSKPGERQVLAMRALGEPDNGLLLLLQEEQDRTAPADARFIYSCILSVRPAQGGVISEVAALAGQPPGEKADYVLERRGPRFVLTDEAKVSAGETPVASLRWLAADQEDGSAVMTYQAPRSRQDAANPRTGDPDSGIFAAFEAVCLKTEGRLEAAVDVADRTGWRRRTAEEERENPKLDGIVETRMKWTREGSYLLLLGGGDGEWDGKPTHSRNCVMGIDRRDPALRRQIELWAGVPETKGEKRGKTRYEFIDGDGDGARRAFAEATDAEAEAAMQQGRYHVMTVEADGKWTTVRFATVYR